MSAQVKHRANIIAIVATLFCGACLGQAWVPPKGEGEFSITYQNAYTADHLWGDGSRADLGKVRLLGMTQAVDFGLTDKLAVTAALPVFSGKYTGDAPHALPIDDGHYHGGVQDLAFTVRYQTTEKPVVFTPFMGFSVPTWSYQHFAHSAIGTSMWTVGLGLNVGRRLDPVLPNGYFQARYTYVITEKIQAGAMAVRPNKSRMDGELGYFVSPRFSVHANANALITHSPLDSPQDIGEPVITNPLFFHHDQIEATRYFNFGGGVNVSATKSLDVFATVARTVWGENMHKLSLGLAVGMSWSFRTPRARGPVMFGENAGKWRKKQAEVKTCH